MGDGMKEIRVSKLEDGWYTAALEGGSETLQYLTIDSALLALLLLNGDKLEIWDRRRIVGLAKNFNLDSEIAPGDVSGLKITLIENCYTKVEQIKKQFQFPPEATKRWRVTHDDFPGEVRHVWTEGIKWCGDREYCEGSFYDLKFALPQRWLQGNGSEGQVMNPERMHWEVIADGE